MFLLNLLQAHGQEAGHGAQPAEAAGHAAAAHAEHVPFIVEKLNHWIGEPVFELQKVIMPPIYKYLKIFGPEWPGEDKTFQQYLDARRDVFVRQGGRRRDPDDSAREALCRISEQPATVL